ncbi:peptidase S8/S53 subtilisin kexin sedolisin, partial [Streptomyces sp. WAC 05977]
MKLRSITKRMFVLGLLTALGTTGATSVATAEPQLPPAEVNATGQPHGTWDPIGPNSVGGLLAVSPAG